MNILRSLALPRKMLVWQFLMAGVVNILSLALPIMLLQVYDRIIPHHAFGTLAFLSAGVLVALLCDGFLRMARAYLASWWAMKQEYHSAKSAMNVFLNSDITEFRKRTGGSHLQSMMALAKLREFYSGQALMALVDFPFVLMFLAMIAYLGGALVWVPICVLSTFILMAVFTGKSLRSSLEKRNHSDDVKSGFIVSVLSAIHTVKAIGAERMLTRRFENVQKNVTHDSYSVARSNGASLLLSSTFGQMTLIVTVTLGAVFVIQGHMSVGGLSACTILAGRTIQPVQRILGAWLRLQDLSVSHDQAEILMSMPVQERQDNPLLTHLGHIAFR